MERLVIFGGTFDPIHRGHLRIAREASFALNADVVFVPAKSPRWKEPEASAKERLKMLNLALQEDGSSSFYISDCELKRADEVTYSIDTVRYFKGKYPKKELFLLIGADEVNQFDKWHQADVIAKLCHVLYANRPEISLDAGIISKYQMISLNFDNSGEVSSSAVRQLKSIDVPSKVLAYIEKNDLYFIKKIKTFLSEPRFLHSLEVAHLAYLIAISNEIAKPERAYIAGILHDIGKEIPKEQSLEIMEKHFPQYKDYPSFSFHQFTGSFLAKKEFGIQDETILDAIMYHCTGKAHMPSLTKIVFSADKIEPTRGYDSSMLIRECKKNYYRGFLKVIEENAKFLKDKNGFGTNKLSEECYNEYLNK